MSIVLNCPRCDSGRLPTRRPVCNNCGARFETRGRVLVLEDAPVEEDYSAEGAGTQARVSSDHFWFDVRRRRIAAELDWVDPERRLKHLVEYGCSNGHVMSHLEHLGWTVTGVDMHVEALRNAERHTRGELVCGRLETVHFEAPPDGVLLFDVIEHLDDDEGALRHAVGELAPGGVLALTVPAMPALHSEFDDLLGHKRRYTRQSLGAVLASLPIDVMRLRYFFSYAAPIVWAQRRFGRRTAPRSRPELWARYYQPPPRPLNRILARVGEWETASARWLDPPFGTSLLAIARKTGASA